jgi:hypothetical protein
LSKILFTAVTGILLLGLSMQTAAAEPAEQQGLFDKARLTFPSFMSDKNIYWLHANLDQANALGASNKNITLELRSFTLD